MEAPPTGPNRVLIEPRRQNFVSIAFSSKGWLLTLDYGHSLAFWDIKKLERIKAISLGGWSHSFELEGNAIEILSVPGMDFRRYFITCGQEKIVMMQGIFAAESTDGRFKAWTEGLGPSPTIVVRDLNYEDERKRLMDEWGKRLFKRATPPSANSPEETAEERFRFW